MFIILQMYNKTIIEFGYYYNYWIIEAEGEADNAYQDLDNSAYHKDLIQ
jgi:hypothetical protein